jgi:SAM-dependent methyltransferase
LRASDRFSIVSNSAGGVKGLPISAFKNFRSGASIADVLKSRGVHTLVYFHTDHFEPWRLVPDRDGGMERCIDDVEKYLSSMAQLDFARKASLFYKANVNYLMSADRELVRVDPEDLLGFVPRSPRDRSIGRGIVEPIVASSHDLQVHIHHEYYTFNDTPRDANTFAYLQTPRGRSFDDARLELGIRLGLDTLREDGGVELDRWFFIHGHWALNGSDPHECNVVREIEILKRNGCLGDFTQPAGRIHVDSRMEAPYLVEPVPAAKGYDTPASNPIDAAGARTRTANRFFIWASASTHRTCSIDTYSSFVQQRLRTPEATALDHAKTSVVIDGVLYLKTHSHSLQPVYFARDGLPMPHLDPGVQMELRTLFKAADRVGIEVRFSSVSEVYDAVLDATPAAPRDLVHEFQLGRTAAMEPLGLTVEFRTPDGHSAPPPELGARSHSLPAPSLAEVRTLGDIQRRGVGAESLVSAYIVPLSHVSLGDDARPLERQEPLIDAKSETPALMDALDVIRLNREASSVAIESARELGGEGSGVTGFYGPRAQQRELLQPSEVLCAHFVQTHLTNAHSVYEIGCGLGLLSTLLALRGVAAVGVERNGARLATAQRIAQKVANGAKAPKWIRGSFPKALRRGAELASSVALVTNLLGSATPEQQDSFISGLADFGAVVIDTQRFYERRVTSAQVDELCKRFLKVGFERPRLAFDLGPDGHFLLFLNPRPRGRFGVKALLSSLGLSTKKQLFVGE